MDLPPQEPNVEDSNRKLDRIRKNILHDVLVYNLEASRNREMQRKIEHDREQMVYEDLLKKEREELEKEEEGKRLNMIQKRRMLQQEYDRQIKAKKQREEQERKYEQMYAKIEKQYQIYSNERRIYDLERIYNRRGYKARIVDGERKSNRYRTEPVQNPQMERYEYPKINERSQKRKQQGIQSSFDGGYQYRDSLDKLEIQGTPAHKRSEQLQQHYPSSPQLETEQKRVNFM